MEYLNRQVNEQQLYLGTNTTTTTTTARHGLTDLGESHIGFGDHPQSPSAFASSGYQYGQSSAAADEYRMTSQDFFSTPHNVGGLGSGYPSVSPVHPSSLDYPTIHNVGRLNHTLNTTANAVTPTYTHTMPSNSDPYASTTRSQYMAQSNKAPGHMTHHLNAMFLVQQDEELDHLQHEQLQQASLRPEVSVNRGGTAASLRQSADLSSFNYYKIDKAAPPSSAHAASRKADSSPPAKTPRTNMATPPAVQSAAAGNSRTPKSGPQGSLYDLNGHLIRSQPRPQARYADESPERPSFPPADLVPTSAREDFLLGKENSSFVGDKVTSRGDYVHTSRTSSSTYEAVRVTGGVDARKRLSSQQTVKYAWQHDSFADKEPGQF